MINAPSTLTLILLIAAITQLLRFLPFIIFRNKTPKALLYLGEVLPFSIMAMLVVYCLRNMTFFSSPFGLPEIICVGLVVVVHKLKHNTLVSIVSGTLAYMLLVQVVF